MTLASVGTRRGKLHIARRVGGAWDCACWRWFPVRRADLDAFAGDEAIPAYSIERKAGMTCAGCDALLDAGREAFAAATGWDLFEALTVPPRLGAKRT